MDVLAAVPAAQAWELELDRLELDVIQCERMLRIVRPPTVESWTPPDLGPLPAELADRARSLHARQLQVQNALAEAVGATARQREYAERVVDSTVAPALPAYLDLSV